MKMIITILFVVHCSLFTLHELYARSESDPIISKSVAFFESKPIREMRIILPGEHEKEQWMAPNRFQHFTSDMRASSVPVEKPVLQKTQGHCNGRGPMLNFEGVGNVTGGWPADPNGDVGPDHYVQIVNCAFGVWDKSGNILYGPVDYQTIWASYPGPWDNYFWCDPVVKYDQLADRWVMISMSFNYVDYYTMIAVSTTSDPLGSYYCYAYSFTELNDYPKLSVWPDGYYVTYNIWDYNADTYLYTLYSVVDRDAMLNGAPVADMIQFQVQDPGEGFFFPLPADSRGNLTPAGTPCYMVTLGGQISANPWLLSLDIYAFTANWDVPANSTFDQVAQFDIGPFNPITDLFGPGSPQLGSDINVMTIPLYLMYPLTYRMFSDHESMVCCQTLWDGEIHYIKWYELRKETDDWYIYQTGNYAPGNEHYFIPSISINGNGDIALAYSISSEEMYPSIHYTGRQAEDSLGIMSFQEVELYKGLNYANTYQADYDQNRWGDYSSMMVDPSDDTTFWYTNMYTLATTESGNWATRIFTLDLSEGQSLPFAFAGNDTLAQGVMFFETQGEAENYSSIVWTTGGDGNFIQNYAEHAIYLRGPGDLDSGQVTLTMNLTGYYPGTQAVDSMVLYFQPTGIRESQPTAFRLNLFPNPACNHVSVDAKCPGQETILLKLSSANGRLLFTGSFPATDNGFEKQLDVSFLDKGNYLITIQVGNQQVTEKLVVH